MNIKALEIRDAATFIPVVAIQMRAHNDEERYLLRRSGYSHDSSCILLCRMEASGVDRNATYDPYSWGGARTMTVAHKYIEDNWENLWPGDVIDVEFILKETQQPKVSERYQ